MAEKRSRGFRIPSFVLKKANARGIPLGKLVEMVRLSARVTHPKGNRRYEDTVFLIKGGEVIDLFPFEQAAAQGNSSCETCYGVGKIPVFDACEVCNGVGCDACDKGLVMSSIACPACHGSPIGKMRGTFDNRIG